MANYKPMVDTIQNRIRALIKASNFQQNEVANHVGVSPQAITKWLKSGKIEKQNLIALCRLTNSSVEWVLEGKGEMFNKGKAKGVNEQNVPYTNDEQDLIDEYRDLSPADKARLVAISKAFNPKLDKETS